MEVKDSTAPLSDRENTLSQKFSVASQYLHRGFYAGGNLIRYFQTPKHKLRQSVAFGIPTISIITGTSLSLEQIKRLTDSAELAWEADEDFDPLVATLESNPSFRTSSRKYYRQISQRYRQENWADRIYRSGLPDPQAMADWIETATVIEWYNIARQQELGSGKPELKELMHNPQQSREFGFGGSKMAILQDMVRARERFTTGDHVFPREIEDGLFYRQYTAQKFIHGWIAAAGIQFNPKQQKIVEAVTFSQQLADDFGTVGEDLRYGIPSLNPLTHRTEVPDRIETDQGTELAETFSQLTSYNLDLIQQAGLNLHNLKTPARQILSLSIAILGSGLARKSCPPENRIPWTNQARAACLYQMLKA